MKSQIKWSKEDKINNEYIDEMERYLDIKFSKKYIQIIQNHNSAKILIKNDLGEWKEGLIYVKEWDGGSAVLSLIDCADNTNIKKRSLAVCYDAFKESMPNPKKMFPFAVDGGGNVFLFDYRKDENNPSIKFIDHDEAYTEEDLTDEELEVKTVEEWLDENLYHVCDSFEELFELIERRED